MGGIFLVGVIVLRSFHHSDTAGQVIRSQIRASGLQKNLCHLFTKAVFWNKWQKKPRKAANLGSSGKRWRWWLTFTACYQYEH